MSEEQTKVFENINQGTTEFARYAEENGYWVHQINDEGKVETHYRKTRSIEPGDIVIVSYMIGSNKEKNEITYVKGEDSKVIDGLNAEFVLRPDQTNDNNVTN